VVELKNLKFDRIIGAAILPVFEEKIVLIEMFRPALDKSCLEIPHGFLMSDETRAYESLGRRHV
jgi:hypothetical protein